MLDAESAHLERDGGRGLERDGPFRDADLARRGRGENGGWSSDL
jgi:hypothetical protein